MNALISQHRHDDDFARGHAVTPARLPSYTVEEARRMEDALVEAYRKERKKNGAAPEKKRTVPTGLSSAEASRAARKISARFQRDWSQAAIYNALIDHGPLTVPELEVIVRTSGTSVRRWCAVLVADGLIEEKRERHASKGNAMSVWHVVAAQ